MNRFVNFSKLVTNEFKLDEINIAIECMQSGNSNGRCLININDTKFNPDNNTTITIIHDNKSSKSNENYHII